MKTPSSHTKRCTHTEPSLRCITKMMIIITTIFSSPFCHVNVLERAIARGTLICESVSTFLVCDGWLSVSLRFFCKYLKYTNRCCVAKWNVFRSRSECLPYFGALSNGRFKYFSGMSINVGFYCTNKSTFIGNLYEIRKHLSEK